jgi:hypothetical protein
MIMRMVIAAESRTAARRIPRTMMIVILRR